jgi:hypothetical protein
MTTQIPNCGCALGPACPQERSLPPKHSLQLALSDEEVCELYVYLYRIVDALWDAYKDVLMETYFRDEDVRANDERLAAELDRREQEYDALLFSDRDIPY